MENPTYLGDAVYGFFDGFGIELRLNDHRNVCAVYLEPSVIEALNRFLEKSKEAEAPQGPTQESAQYAALVKDIDSRVDDLKARRSGLAGIKSKIESLGLVVSVCGDYLDFDRLNHADVIRVIGTFGGKWTKTPLDGEARINYTRDESIGGVTIRCWAGSPPPNCKVMEVEEEIPEEIIPAHTKRVRKLVCAHNEEES